MSHSTTQTDNIRDKRQPSFKWLKLSFLQNIAYKEEKSVSLYVYWVPLQCLHPTVAHSTTQNDNIR